MSVLGLSDDLRDDDVLVAALLGLSRGLALCQQWRATLERADSSVDMCPPDADFMDCLLGIAALVAKLEPVLRDWSAEHAEHAGGPTEPVRAPKPRWQDILR